MRTKNAILPALVSTLSVTTLLAQPPIDDALWVAARQGRMLTKVSRSGQVLQSVNLATNGFDLRGVARAPNGDLWVVNFITTTMTILDRNGGNLQNITTAGTAFGVAFDRLGFAYVTMSNLGRVDKFTPTGTLVTTFTVGANPLGITIDNAGNVFCAHRNTAPAAIGMSRIDAVTQTVTQHAMPAASRLQPIAIEADYRGLATPSHLWIVGDGSNELVEMDNAGNVLNTYLLGTASGLNSVAVDAGNNVWVANFANGNVYKVDSNTGTILFNFLSTPTAIGVTMDAMGHPWVLNRVSFSGPQPSELRRFNATSGTPLEVFAPTSNGSPGLTDSAGFHFAFVVDQTGDADGDGDSNIREVLTGTSPYDAQSSSNATLDTTGPTQLGQTCQLVGGGPAGVMVVLIGRATGPGLPIPGITDLLLLDPLQLTSIILSFPCPGSLPLSIPADPSLNGASVHFQGIHAATSLRFSNVASVLLWQ